ncbi:hypothetical protein L4L49_29800, partial [Klebsiella pneumoniae]|uniref:hypothetical protein n=1 Tax=Klebsiella pneumoniae TaxID=573 RepID=UPI001F479A0D
DEPAAHLPAMTLGEEVVEDYVSTRLTLKAHPVALLRHILTPGTPPIPGAPAALPPSRDAAAGPARPALPAPVSYDRDARRE